MRPASPDASESTNSRGHWWELCAWSKEAGDSG